MKHVKLYEEFVSEAKAGADIKPGEYVKTQYGYFYQRVDGMVGGQPAFVNVDPDKKSGLKIGKKKTGIHTSTNYEKVTLEDIKKEFGINEAKLSKVEILIDVLANLEDAFTEEEFVEMGVKDLKMSAKTMTEIFNAYWDLDPKFRLKWNTENWADWLKKNYGISESINESVDVEISVRYAREAGDLFDDMFKSYGKKTSSNVFSFTGKDADEAAYDFVNMILKHTKIPKDEIESDDKEIKRLLEGITENINDPVLVALRAAKDDRKKILRDWKKIEAQKDRMKKRVYGKQREKLEDELWEISQDLKDAYAYRREIYNEMEAEAGEKGDAWSDDDANRYGDALNKTDDTIENLIKKRQEIEIKLAY